MNSRIKNHIAFWIAPSLFLLVCMSIYFLDVLGLSFVIAPGNNREFGLIENVQLLTILSITFLAFRSAQRSDNRLEKIFYTGVSIFSFIIFLEEIDYGIHFYELIMNILNSEGEAKVYQGQIRNIHNQGDIRHYIKIFVYTSFVLFLGLLPLIKHKLYISNPALKWIIPSSKYFGLSLVSMALLNRLAVFLDQNVKDPVIDSLNGNTMEFEECYIYYIALLYFYELTNKTFPLMKLKLGR